MTFRAKNRRCVQYSQKLQKHFRILSCKKEKKLLPFMTFSCIIKPFPETVVLAMSDCKRMRAAVFDLDGTLCCTVNDLLAAVNHMLSQFGFPLQDGNSILLHINEGGYEFVRKSLPAAYWEDSTVCDRAMKLYCAYCAEHPCDRTYVYPGVSEAIAEMKAHGVKLACFTNKPHDQALTVMDRMFPAGLFDLIQGAGVFPMKPAPDGVLWILSQLGVQPPDAVYFGDSDLDIRTARNAGVCAAGVAWGYRTESVLREAGADAICREGMEMLRFFI